MKYRSLENWKYQLEEDESVIVDIPDDVFIITDYITLASGYLTCKSCYAWDGPSGPTFDTATVMRASLFHDALCQLIAEGLLDKEHRKYADELLQQLMLEDSDMVLDSMKKNRLKRYLYDKWRRFRAWYWLVGVRGYSKLKGM